MKSLPTIAVDIGNNRVKLGLYTAATPDAFPQPQSVEVLSGAQPAWGRLEHWLAELNIGQLGWWIASVNRPVTSRLLDWLRERRPADPVTLLSAGDLPLKVDVERPDMVGVDRLVNAVAANFLRQADTPAVVVDVGSAITVDLVSASGAFCGGAILPGIAMSARALHEFTDLLPLVEMAELHEPPAALGRATVPAMQSGLFWSAVGAVRALVEELQTYAGAPPEVLLTGGAGPAVAPLIGPRTRHEPHLTLGGIALATADGSPTA